MALGWLTVLQSVPWIEVVRNAPKVAAGAKKLWDNVANKGAAHDAQAPLTPSDAEPTLASLQADVAALLSVTRALQQRLGESSALVSELAEQNTQLIARVDVLRRRQKLLSWALFVLAALAAGVLGLTLA
jgi:hypothetical protein